MNFHSEVLTTVQTRVLRQLSPIMSSLHFYLGGGTALAIHLGHRHSVDLDWFTEDRISDPLLLAQEVQEKGAAFVTAQVERGTLHGTIFRVRVSFLEYRYRLLEAPVSWSEVGCLLASLDDLAAMKLAAVAQRGAKKDFVDVYALGLRYRPLRELLQLYQRKYSLDDIAHVLYGLAYFDDADRERMPRVLWPTSWRTIKRTIQQWVREIAG
jgi:predicted nucleotidyltransferase component of viral defense system